MQLSKETQIAIDIFRRHHAKRFYTDRMIKVEDQVTAQIPKEEFAEFVRITTEIQDEES